MSSGEASPPLNDARRPGWLLYGLGAFILIGLLLLLVSLNAPTTPKSTETTAARPEEDIDQAIQETLRKGADLAACRSVIDQLNRWLTNHSDQQPKAADAAALKQLRVSEGEIQSADSPRFTPLDAHYLELTFLLAEAARALDVDQLPPPQRALTAFDWVCRQVRLREQPGEPYPAHMVLRRGWGTSLERAVIFATLLEHLDMTACFVDCPHPAGGWRFWLAGARADGQVYLFEPRLAVPLRNATSEIATLEQLRRQPDLVKQLDLGDSKPDVTADQAAAALAQPAGYLSALTPRMRYLQEKLARPVKLSGDADQFVKDFQPLAGKELMYRNLTRLLQSYLPTDQGGLDRGDKQGVPRSRRFEQSLIDGRVFPRELAAVPPVTYLGQRIYNHFEQPFLSFYFHEKSPRELLIRGRLDEATAGFVDTIERAGTLKARLDNRARLRDEVQEWLKDAGPADQAVDEAQGKPEAEAAAALQRAEEVWKKSEPVQILLLAAAASSVAGQADYCLALAKHEQAERAQRHAPADAAPLWRTAAERWQKHRADYPATYADARLHQARALAMLGQIDEALALLENPPAALDHWNKHAHLIRARTLRASK